jgi:cation transport regulator ChaC
LRSRAQGFNSALRMSNADRRGAAAQDGRYSELVRGESGDLNISTP